jgi:hypothetical protein
MKRTLTAFTAAIFAGALAIPAFAQVGAGVAGNANVGSPTMHEGANRDLSNDDAERVEPAAPLGSLSPNHRPEGSKTQSNSHKDAGANAGVGAGANIGAGASAGSDNSPTGGH